MSGSPERTNVFSRIRRDRSESPGHRPGGKRRRDRGVFNRLGGKGKSVSAHSESRFQSFRSERTESVPRKRHHEGTCSRRTEMLSENGGQRAVLFDRFRGVIDDTVGEGTHFLIPWLQKPYIFDIRTRPHTFSSVSGLGYDEKVLPSIGNEVLKAVVAQFNADQLLTERPRVSALVRDSLVRRAKDFNIELDDVAITHLSYGAEFSKAVEQKQVAQQEAERSKFVVAKAEQERRAAIIRAEGESESAKLISDATSTAGMGLIELRRIEASREIAATLARSKNVMYLPNSGSKMLLGL
nr:prohibitin-3, mitochondrial [Tanacetum cinerariifolium]